MIRNIDEIIRRGGCYVGDFRYDEGIRIREDFISPTLCARHGNNSSISGMVLLIEVKDEKVKSEECD